MAFQRLTRSHPRLSIATLAGLLGGILIPSNDLVQRFLLGWNLGIWLYLLLILHLTCRSAPRDVRRIAGIQDENAGLVLFTVCIAAIVLAHSVVGFVFNTAILGFTINIAAGLLG